MHVVKFHVHTDHGASLQLSCIFYYLVLIFLGTKLCFCIYLTELLVKMLEYFVQSLLYMLLVFFIYFVSINCGVFISKGVKG